MKVTKAHTANIFGVSLEIPEGLATTNQTAIGYDESYNFLDDFSFLPKELQYLKHDLTYYGYNVPKEFLKKL